MFGTWLSSVGITIFIHTGIGADPISTFLMGIIHFVSIPFGTASQIFNITILVALFFIDRHLINVGSLLNAFFVGFFINLCTPVILTITHSIWLPARVVLGPLLLGIGTGIYLSADFGSGALESVMLFLSEKRNVSIKIARMLLDFSLVALGGVLGAPIGIGTVIGILMIGPIIEGTLRFIKNIRKEKKIV